MGPDPMSVAPAYDELRPLLFSIAYRMIGSVSEAEDIVQETYLRFHRAAGEEEIESPKAYLSQITTRLAINHLKSARARRETYVGQWIPEPLLTDQSPDPAEHAETADSLSLAFLVLLESLSPVERAVFILREVFAYEYDEIARIVGKSEENCRQLAVRARRQVEERKPRFEASRQRKDELANRFFAAIESGHFDELEKLLAADVVVYADGGGKAPAVPRPIIGVGPAARFLRGASDRGRALIAAWRLAEINGQPGGIFFDAEGRVLFVVSLDIADGLVQTFRAIANPDKLRHLGPVADPGQFVLPPRADRGERD